MTNDNELFEIADRLADVADELRYYIQDLYKNLDKLLKSNNYPNLKIPLQQCLLLCESMTKYKFLQTPPYDVKRFEVDKFYHKLSKCLLEYLLEMSAYPFNIEEDDEYKKAIKNINMAIEDLEVNKFDEYFL